MNDDQGNLVGDPACRFLNAFHIIEGMLRKQQNKGEWVPFSDLVRDSKGLDRRQKGMLLDLARLRNAIAHTPYDERDEPYARQMEPLTAVPITETAKTGEGSLGIMKGLDIRAMARALGIKTAR